MSVSDGKERRRYARVVAENVSAHLNATNGSTPCLIENISAGGLFIQTKEALPVGMPVAVNLARPGWKRVLRLSGRVVWAVAEKTASRKGTVPGMRIRFDPLPLENATQLAALLSELGATDVKEPPPNPEPKKVRVTKEIPIVERERIAAKRASDEYAAKAEATTDPEVRAYQDVGEVGRTLVRAETEETSGSPRLMVQVQGLLMQLGDLQQQLEVRDRELMDARARLAEKEADLAKAERERRAAELAVQRLSLQISTSRR